MTCNLKVNKSPWPLASIPNESNQCQALHISNVFVEFEGWVGRGGVGCLADKLLFSAESQGNRLKSMLQGRGKFNAGKD